MDASGLLNALAWLTLSSCDLTEPMDRMILWRHLLMGAWRQVILPMAAMIRKADHPRCQTQLALLIPSTTILQNAAKLMLTQYTMNKADPILLSHCQTTLTARAQIQFRSS
ncbi:hypothetical protein F4860DRAFT_483402 [Xylaria cubensis]|nr:hypothetical protein F4860DRAFT_483402 [Xylaria cubensis]